MASVLLVEDDPVIRGALIEVLSAHGHVVHSAALGFEALREVTARPPDVVVLDLGLPDLDGTDVLRMLRGISRVPVVVATARDDDAEVIKLLNAGADDYVVKPFSGGQLAARIGAVLRRTAPAEPAPAPPAGDGSGSPAAPAVARTMRVGELVVDLPARSARLAGRELRLTRREFDLLAYLAAHADQVVSRRRILADVWRQPYVEDQTIDVHLSALRRKLGERASQPRYLHTVRGIGIKLVAPR
ncbi:MULTISPECIES: response regulator transcription factor [Streptomyces]|uniref:Response regulator transcription factor n=1 Tax=Streptomyces lycii TaxID=2654337 RepID=A0ABQ7FLJ6_9ACTN|nr:MULTISPECIES: response regulator transcription factor [Streptomyces]KAF4409831.1 response regulator transcription factor [Streptomyces lycii]PGH52033.1 DNA-binding response regulator [Streptomyces sp. Ru87]